MVIGPMLTVVPGIRLTRKLRAGHRYLVSRQADDNITYFVLPYARFHPGALESFTAVYGLTLYNTFYSTY